MSEPRRPSTGLNGVQLTFAVNHVSQRRALSCHPNQLKFESIMIFLMNSNLNLQLAPSNRLQSLKNNAESSI